MGNSGEGGLRSRGLRGKKGRKEERKESHTSQVTPNSRCGGIKS